ncbi:hypothetical protein JCM6882_008141 [Rhodosporidiobolus microsporus]
MATSNENRLATPLESAGLLGPPAAGWSAAILLYGVYLVIHFNYTRSEMYGKALPVVRWTLWAVFVLLGVYTGMTIAEQMLWTITTDRTVTFIIDGTRYESFPPLLGGLVAAPVQALLMARTAALIRRRLVRYAFFALMTGAILLGVAFAILVCAANLLIFDNAIDRLSPLDFNSTLGAWMWTTAGVDITVSISLALTLKQRVAGFSERTDGLLHRLIQSALQTAAYTSILAVVGAAVATVYSDSNPRFTFLSYAFWTPLPACYGLSLYTTLSTRRTVEEYIGSSVPIPGSAQHEVSNAAGRLGTRTYSSTAAPRYLNAEYPLGRGMPLSEKRTRDGFGKTSVEEDLLTDDLERGV